MGKMTILAAVLCSSTAIAAVDIPIAREAPGITAGRFGGAPAG